MSVQVEVQLNDLHKRINFVVCSGYQDFQQRKEVNADLVNYLTFNDPDDVSS